MTAVGWRRLLLCGSGSAVKRGAVSIQGQLCIVPCTVGLLSALSMLIEGTVVLSLTS